MPVRVRGDVVLPVAVLVSRFEKRAEHMRQAEAALPWWAWRRRYAYIGALAAYELEVRDLLETGGRHQPFWHELIGQEPRPAPDRQRR